MRIRLKLKDGSARKARPGEQKSLVDGACPSCGAEPFYVAGDGARPSADDRAYECTAYCLACKARVGTVRAEVDTLFGVEEDERVLHGRCRVY